MSIMRWTLFLLLLLLLPPSLAIKIVRNLGRQIHLDCMMEAEEMKRGMGIVR